MLAVNDSDSYTRVSFVSKTSVDGVPPGAVIGGHTADGFPLYVIQMFLMGNLDARNDYGEYVTHSSNNIPRNDTEWRYLIVEYSELWPQTLNHLLFPRRTFTTIPPYTHPIKHTHTHANIHTYVAKLDWTKHRFIKASKPRESIFSTPRTGSLLQIWFIFSLGMD